MSSLTNIKDTVNKIVVQTVQKFYFLFSDKLSLKIQYRVIMGRRLNLKNPTRFSEKLQWLKLYDRKPIYSTMVDKITAKDYVAGIIGKDYIIPTLGVWDHFDEIDFDQLPDKFVLKTNHSGGSSGVVICRNKSKFNKERAKIRLEKSLKQSVYHTLREWPYKNIQPKIFAEELLEVNEQHGLMDYKVFCCNGEPKMVKVNYDVAKDYHVNWYDLNWDRIEGTTIYDPTDMTVVIERPKLLEDMLAKARVLSKGVPYLRVDFYCVDNELKFGELTFFPGSGFEQFKPDSFDFTIGSWITLPDRIDGGGVIIKQLRVLFDCKDVGVSRKKVDLWDYKFYCFNGEPKVLMIASNRFTTHNFDYYDMDFHRLNITSKEGPNSSTLFPKPKQFDEMKMIAKKLCNGLKHVRVDMYATTEKPYFGELTLYDSSGFDNLSSDEIDLEWGSWINLK